MDKFKEMEKALEERVRQMEARVESIDMRNDKSPTALPRSDRSAFESKIEEPSLSGHVEALEICMEELLEHMLPHIDVILTEMERRVPAIYLPPLSPTATSSVPAPTPTTRNKTPKRNRRPLSGNFTPTSLADTPLSPTKQETSPSSPTVSLSPTTVTPPPSSRSPPRNISSTKPPSAGIPISPTKNGQNSFQPAPTVTTNSPFPNNNVPYATLPRSTPTSAVEYTASGSTATTRSSIGNIITSRILPSASGSPAQASSNQNTLHSTPGTGTPIQIPLSHSVGKGGTVELRPSASKNPTPIPSITTNVNMKLPSNTSSSQAIPIMQASRVISFQNAHQRTVVTTKSSGDVNSSHNSTPTVYSINGSRSQTASTITGIASVTMNSSFHGNTNFISTHARTSGQTSLTASNQAPPQVIPTFNGPRISPIIQPLQIASPVNSPRALTGQVPSQSTSSAVNTISQSSSISNLGTTPSVKTTSTGAIPCPVTASYSPHIYEPLQPQLTESALTAQRLANVRKSLPVSSEMTNHYQISTLAASNLSSPTEDRRSVPTPAAAAAGAAAIARASSLPNGQSASGTEHSGDQVSSLVEPPIGGQRVVPPSTHPNLFAGSQQPIPTSSVLNHLPDAQQIVHSSTVPGQQPLSSETDPIASVTPSGPVVRPSILKETTSANRPNTTFATGTAHAPISQIPAQPKQVRFDVPPSPVTDHPLVDISQENSSLSNVSSGAQRSPRDMSDLLKSSSISGNLAEVLEALDGGADINSGDTHGQRPLHWAAWCDHADIVEALVRRGADLELRNDLGLAPLHMAARGGSAQCVAFLLDAGVQADARGSNQRTALHLAAVKGHEAVVQVLLAWGADRGLLDGEGKTAFDLATTDDIRGLLVY